ncbi:MAG: hypothetical protein GF365_02660 [Candidatus Buchananbacteria bacterium]|nr:hypothetical protein [Candidatus Buchananbacteria bacterium]
MTKFLTFDLNNAYSELKQKAELEAITNKEAWNSMVDNYVVEKVDIGELDPDQDLEQIKLDLKAKWPIYEENLNIK